MFDDHRVARAILVGSGAGIGVLDPDLRYLYVNDALAALNGIPAAEHLGKRIPDLLPDLDFEPMEKVLRAVLRDGRPQSTTVTGRTPSDPSAEPRWWVNAYHRLEDEQGAVLGVVGVVIEVTETYRVRRLLDRARTRLALLDEAATRIGTTLDVDLTCKELARLLVPRIADLAAVDVLDLDGTPGVLPAHGSLRLRRTALTAAGRLGRAAKHLGAIGTVATPPASAAVARCLTEQRPVICDLRAEQGPAAEAADPELAAQCRKLGLHSVLYVPLTARRDLVGAVVLVRAGSSPRFTQEDVDLVTDLARRAAICINHAKRYAHEHQTALVLQQALLAAPRLPHPDVQCASRYLPTGADIEIGGDWYDTVALPGGKTLLVVGDVMGHGFEAAAAMSEYRSLLRTLALQSEEPGLILAEADRISDGLAFDRVATCLVAVLDPVRRSCRFANAGHLPPLLIHPDGRSGFVPVPVDPPLGVGPRLGGGRDGDGAGDGPHPYQQSEIAFEPGATLLFYTDGLVERRGKDIEESLAALARLELDPERPLEQLLDTVLTRFDAGASEDDVAVLAARLC